MQLCCMRILLWLLLLVSAQCQGQKNDLKIQTGADQIQSRLIPQLKGKKVGVVANHTSMIGATHLVDSLLASGIEVKKVFAPEHGFRGDIGAGDKVSDAVDKKTGLPLISLYGKNKKPSPEMLNDIEILVFDIQDVGARFYTYISTMYNVMEACAENNKGLIVLDRPNPNGFYIDGPVLNINWKSFVGIVPIPVVHGCTIGELSQMINGEHWLGDKKHCNLTVIDCKNYTHSSYYELPIPPSPNLPNMNAIYAYPSLCFFEGTAISIGRGTDHPFQCFGYPLAPHGQFQFTPKDKPGVVQNPPYKGEVCNGHLVDEFSGFWFKNHRKIYLDWLVGAYHEFPDKQKFFTSPDFFDKLAGGPELRQWIIEGKNAEEIRQLYSPQLNDYMTLRRKYLLYPDFQ